MLNNSWRINYHRNQKSITIKHVLQFSQQIQLKWRYDKEKICRTPVGWKALLSRTSKATRFVTELRARVQGLPSEWKVRARRTSKLPRNWIGKVGLERSQKIRALRWNFYEVFNMRRERYRIIRLMRTKVNMKSSLIKQIIPPAIKKPLEWIVGKILRTDGRVPLWSVNESYSWWKKLLASLNTSIDVIWLKEPFCFPFLIPI